MTRAPTGMRSATEMYSATAAPTAAMTAPALFRSGERRGRKGGSDNCDYNTETEIPF